MRLMAAGDDLDLLLSPSEAETWRKRERLERIYRGRDSTEDPRAAEELIRWIAGTMTAVATGDLEIKAANPEYQQHYRALAAVLRRLGIDNPNPFDDLWTFYGHWRAELPTYADRRVYVTGLYAPVRGALDDLAYNELVDPVADRPTGWAAIDAAILKLRRSYAAARDASDCKSIGLQCGSILQQLGRHVFDPERHLPAGEAEPSCDDAKRRIGFYVDSVTAGRGSAFSEIRKLAISCARLAEVIKHAPAPTRVEAGTCADATIQLVQLVRRLMPLEQELT